MPDIASLPSRVVESAPAEDMLQTGAGVIAEKAAFPEAEGQDTATTQEAEGQVAESAIQEGQATETAESQEAEGQAAGSTVCSESPPVSGSLVDEPQTAATEQASAAEAPSGGAVEAPTPPEEPQMTADAAASRQPVGPAAPASVGASSTRSRSGTNYEELLNLSLSDLDNLPEFSSSDGSDEEKLRKRGKKRKHQKKKEKRARAPSSATPTPSRAGAAAQESRSNDKERKAKKAKKEGHNKERFAQKVEEAVDEYIAAHKNSWTASVMRLEIAEANGWENDKDFEIAVKGALLTLGFTKSGARV